MKHLTHFGGSVGAVVALAGLIWLGSGPVNGLRADEPQTPAASAAGTATNASPASTTGPTIKKRLTGAELYSIHCNRCHPERFPTERTAAQWKTIMLHMQVRASIPGQQAKLILQYLQENSGR